MLKLQIVTNTDPFTMLAIAIVKRAAEDYRILGRKLSDATPYETRQISQCMKEITDFFKSEWCAVLCGSDCGPRLSAILDKEVFRN